MFKQKIIKEKFHQQKDMKMIIKNKKNKYFMNNNQFHQHFQINLIDMINYYKIFKVLEN